MYRVMVVNSNMDESGAVCNALARGDLIPYDSAKHTWKHAEMVRKKALEFFPAVVVIFDEDVRRLNDRQFLNYFYGLGCV